MVFSWDIKQIVKKKYVVPSKDKKDWFDFTKQIDSISPKEADLLDQSVEINKIKKLDLHPGQKVLDIGCGWGGMAFEIARQSQCEITGISLSKNQINYCRQKAKELKLDNQVHFELCDYRDVKGKYDRILNVGMLEHVHPKYYDTFFKKICYTLNI